MTDCYLSVIIPAYNEESHLIFSLNKLYEFISNNNFTFDIILVDDGSKDNTCKIASEFFSSHELNDKYHFNLIENKINKGKGFSIRKGLERATGKFILFTDADFSTPIEESQKLLGFLNVGYDIAIGSRALKDSKLIRRQNIFRMYMGKFFNLIVRRITGLNFMDTQCGFKMFTSKAKNLLLPYLKIDDFSFDVEILYIAKKLNLKVKEMPISWINSPDSKVRIIKDSIKMFFSLIKIKNLHSV